MERKAVPVEQRHEKSAEQEQHLADVEERSKDALPGHGRLSVASDDAEAQEDLSRCASGEQQEEAQRIEGQEQRSDQHRCPERPADRGDDQKVDQEGQKTLAEAGRPHWLRPSITIARNNSGSMFRPVTTMSRSPSGALPSSTAASAAAPEPSTTMRWAA